MRIYWSSGPSARAPDKARSSATMTENHFMIHRVAQPMRVWQWFPRPRRGRYRHQRRLRRKSTRLELITSGSGRGSSQRELSAGWPADARMELESIENDLGLRHNHRFRHASVEADAQTEQPQEHGQVRMKRAEDSEEENDFHDEVGEQKGVDVMIGRITELVILINHPNAGDQQPDKSDRAKNPERHNDGQGPIVIVANQLGGSHVILRRLH